MARQQLADLYVTWFAAELESRGLDYKDVAAKARLNPASLWKILNRKVVPEDETLEALAKAIDRPLPKARLVLATPLPHRQEPGLGRSPSERSGAVRIETEGTGLATAPGAPIAVKASPESVKQQLQLVHEAFDRVVDEHEVVGLDLRKVFGRMALGLDQLGHHEAATELYALVWKLSKLELGAEPEDR